MLKTRLISSIMVAGVCLCGTLAVSAADMKTVAPIPVPFAQPPDRQVPVPGVNSITQTAVNAGVLLCASRINQVANFLTTGSQGAGAFIFAPPVTPDQQLVSVSLEIPEATGPSFYASASFAPNQANGCGGMYETVVWWPLVCDEVAGKYFGALKRTGNVAKNIVMLDGGPSTRVFLMPAGNGCVSIKKQVIQ